MYYVYVYGRRGMFLFMYKFFPSNMSTIKTISDKIAGHICLFIKAKFQGRLSFEFREIIF